MNVLQNAILRRLQMERQVVTVIMTNGFQMKGCITASNLEIVVLDVKNEQQIVYKHAISTIVPTKPVSLEGVTL